MRRILTFIFAVLACFSASAQERQAFDAFASSLTSGEVSFKYSFKVKADVPLSGNGSAVLSGDSYVIKGNGLEIWCDGKTRWTVDRTACEAYIETVEEDSSDYLANPAMLLGTLSKAFEIKESKNGTFNGSATKNIRLVPAIADTGLDSVVLYLSGNNPRGVKITVDDGTETVFVITSYSVKEPGGIKFSFDVSGLDSSYVVTDLR